MSEAETLVDAQGLACPVPVIRVKRALDSIREGRVIVLVDDPVAKENVLRLASHLGCSPRCEQQGDSFRITIDKPAKPGTPS